MRIPETPAFSDKSAFEAARLQELLTKPRGSLGRLEDLAIKIAGITACPRPTLRHKAVLVAAGDHGVAEEGVSAFPAEVTRQMVLNFLSGGAAVNVLTRQMGARLVVVNSGVRGLAPRAEGLAAQDSHAVLIDKPIAEGTQNMLRGPAMTVAEVEAAFELGRTVLANVRDPRPDILALGEMGIANSTAAAAISAVMTGRSPEEITGRGTGVNDETFRRKQEVVRGALDLHSLDREDPVRVLRCVGGLEIATLVGAMFEAASRRMPVVLDGFICGSAALIAVAMKPQVRDFLIAGHRSAEAGHRAVLEALELEPVLDLDLRLGEASGAVLALPALEAAVRTMVEMATFAEAAVSDEIDSDRHPR